jgi:hypothetical protein
VFRLVQRPTIFGIFVALTLATAGLADDDRDALWSFQPLMDTSPPSVRDTSWPRSDLDRFILAQLEDNELAPAPQARRHDLIRRVTFTLSGLPPTPREIDAFLDDDSPDALDKIVDRLLASSDYGERWGRHWLDLARYADSNGLDENVAHGNAWRYRDYIVDALNEDLPYDEFVVEQIAGDLLDSKDDKPLRRRRLIATAFLSLGPKILTEKDEAKLEMDIIDEQLDTLGRSILGLTIGCARCHDHKFDPLSTEDYYGLAGIFKSTRTMESLKLVARWSENSLATPADIAAKKAHDDEVGKLKKTIEPLEKRVKGGKDITAAEKRTLAASRATLAKLEKAAPELPSAMGVADRKVTDVAVHIRGDPRRLGKIVPRRVPEQLARVVPASFSTEGSGRLELARWIARADHPLTSRVIVNRLWRWHLGRGLVDTPDNFGMRGSKPSHPRLLDHLARRFSRGGWSMKRFHRELLLSSSYRVGATRNERAASADPENRLLALAQVRRLEAETLRDAVLAVSGRLQRGVGGPSLTHVKNRGYFFDHTSKDLTKYDSRRRSIYLPVVRNHLYDAFQLFDYPDSSVASGDRASTTTAPQSLFLLNNDLLLDASESLAERARAAGASLRGRIDAIYRRALGRMPSEREAKRAAAFLAGEADEHWTAFAQVLLMSNEFLHTR